MRPSYTLLLCFLVGCASNPYASARYWNLEQCATMSAQAMRFTRADGALIALIPKTTCDALHSAASKMQYEARFSVSRLIASDVEAANAFATRDKEGQALIGVTIGMLEALGSDEAAWAGLLGHELAHHVKGHGAGRADAKASAQAAGTTVGNVLSYGVGGLGGYMAGLIGGTLTQSAIYGAYTRPQEAEADDLALGWMVAAGYDPRGLWRLFEILSAKNPSVLPPFFSTHPGGDDRKRAIEAFIAANQHRRQIRLSE
jgi:predicted Zn-dependent protease